VDIQCICTIEVIILSRNNLLFGANLYENKNTQADQK
jgi:hypothetical protein